MTRKDYVATAKTLALEVRPFIDNAAYETVVLAMSDLFKSDNGRFDRERFRQACFAN